MLIFVGLIIILIKGTFYPKIIQVDFFSLKLFIYYFQQYKIGIFYANVLKKESKSKIHMVWKVAHQQPPQCIIING